MCEDKTLYASEIINILNLSFPYVKRLRNKGLDLEKLCCIFTNEHIYIRFKRNYLYALTNINENDKNHIWEAFMGDYIDKEGK